MSEIVLYGASLSPFARKVRLCLEAKGLEYQHEQTAPINFPEELLPHTPLRKIPFAKIGDKWLADSSVICAYLERLHPQPALYPADPYEFARVLWIEEYIDGGAVARLGPNLFFERVIAPRFFDRPADEEKIAKAIAEFMPDIYGYLDKEIGNRQYIVGDAYTLADVSIGSFFVNMMHAEAMPTADRWPNLTRYVLAQFERPAIAETIEQETGMLTASV